jgi:hypothetical protein
MNNPINRPSLLAEVLAETSPPDFRAALLAETLRLARRRRQFRQLRRTAEVLTLISLLAVLGIQQFSKPPVVPPPLAKQIPAPNFELVRTQPLPASAIIRTRNFAAGLATPVSKVIEVATGSGGYRLINDNELLALLADKPAILIRTGPNTEELVFANPEDQKYFHAN